MTKTNLPRIDLKTILKLAISLLALFFLWSLYNRFIYADDGWLGEQANAIAKHGLVKTKLFDLYYGQFGMGHVPLYVYHKLFIWLGGLLIYLTGHFNPYLLKSISLTAYIILILIVLYDYRDRMPDRRISSLVLLFYFLALPNFIRISFIYRPEIIVTLFGYLSFRLISKRRDKGGFFLAGLFAGMATLFHLNGLVFILSGMAYIALYHKSFRSVFFFGLGASVCLLYFADVVYHHAYLMWWEQIKVDRAVISSEFNRRGIISWGKVNNLFFRSMGELAYSVPLALSLYFLISNKLKVLKAEISYLVLLILSLYFFSRSGLSYNIYLYPYAIAVITYAIATALSREKRYRGIAIAILTCNLLMGLYKDSYFIFKKNTDISHFYEAINRTIPKHSRVLSVNSIIFDPRFGDYDISSSFNAAMMLRPWNEQQIRKFCMKNRIDYLVVGENFLEKFKINEIKSTFKLTEHVPKDYWIYRVIAPE